MTEDLNLSEDIDLGLDDISADAAVLPDGDFNLDEFLTENAADISEEDNLDLNQEEINLEQMLSENKADESVAVMAEPETPESVVEPAVAPEPEPFVESEADPEVKSETSGWLADDKDAAVESAPAEETPEMSKGWAFDDIEEGAVQETEDAALNETEPVEEAEPETTAFSEPAPLEEVETGVSFDEPEKGWAFDGVETTQNEESADAPVEEASAEEFVQEIPFADDVEVPAYGGEDIAGFARWYSGNYDEAAFELDRHSVSDVLQGDKNRQVIHINVGYDTYGWQVQFADGVSMNLRDVREYQLRNGRLPNPNGTIIYGDMKMIFSNIEKITIYENIRYFSYAPN